MFVGGAIDYVEAVAQRIGFGYRDDYPFLSKSAVSAGDWKGDGVISCVFANKENAVSWLNECAEELVCFSNMSTPKYEIFDIESPTGMDLYVAVIVGQDIGTYDGILLEDTENTIEHERLEVPKSIVCDAARFLFPEIHQTASRVLYHNFNESSKGTWKQIRYLRKLCSEADIAESDLIETAIAEKRLWPGHWIREKPLSLENLTRSETGALFAFVEFLKGFRLQERADEDDRQHGEVS